MATARDAPAQSHLWTLIAGSHILDFHNILDAYGHLSVRHPTKTGVFVMPRNIAPGTLSREEDLVEYYVSDASEVDKSAPKGYAERYIHSEIYKRYPSVQSVIHSHAPAVVPYTMSSVPLKPCFHMAGFLGGVTPVFDIAEHYTPDDTRDLLIRNERLGAALAASLDLSHGEEPSGINGQSNGSVVLMRGHGMTVVGSSIEDCVFRAIYTAENASVQTVALTTHSAYYSNHGEVGEIKYLRPDEWDATDAMREWSYLRPWNLWLKQIENHKLYINNAKVVS